MSLKYLFWIAALLIVTPILAIVLVYVFGSKLPIEMVQTLLPNTIAAFTDIAKVSVGAVAGLLGTYVADQKKNKSEQNPGNSGNTGNKGT